MLATAKLVEDAVAVLYGPNIPLKIDVDADFERGSFDYNLVASLVGQGHTAVAGFTISDLRTVLELIGLRLGSGGGLIGLLRWLRRRPIADATTSGASTTITVTDGTNVTVHANTYNLYRNRVVREDLHGALKPLQSDGVNEFRAGAGVNVASRVVKEEIEYFEPPAASEEVLDDSTAVEVLGIVLVSFQDNTKWKFTQGDETFFAAVLDAEFLRKVRGHLVTFGRGDALRAQVHKRVTRTGDVMKASREVVKVIEVIPPSASQGELFGP